MWHTLFSYSKYLLKSTSKYGIHSPFVYDFITKGLEVKLPEVFSHKLDEYRADLKRDTTSIEVLDFGAGSRVFTSNKRAVNAIAKHASISTKKAQILQKIIFYFKPKNILEIGTSVGVGSAAIKSVDATANIVTLEGCPETARIAKKYLKKHNYNDVELVVGEFSETLKKILRRDAFDLIYIDGNHKKAPTLEYFNDILQNVHNDSICIFDDINWSKEMQEAWGEIKKHPKVTVSIDLFHMGVLFFRKEQVKQDFSIRF